MRLLFFVLLQFFISMPLISYAANMAGPAKKEYIKENKVTESRKTSIAEAYGNLPLYFIENKGQVEKAVKFYEKGAGHATYFTEEGVVLSLSKREDTENDRSAPLNKTINLKKDKKITTESVSLSFIGANKGAKITSSTPLPGRVNYFVGNEKSEWQSNVSTYESVTYEDIYENIDIKFYGNSRDIEHDIIVRPGGDFSKVIFAYRGVKGFKVTKNGDLEVSLAGGVILEKQPIIYQDINGIRKNIDGSYRILKNEKGTFEFGYTVASYDHTKTLIIDPVLTYSTYLGGSDWESIHNITIDASGSVYVTGHTASTDFPLLSPIQAAFSGGYSDTIITKMNPAGTALVYSTYLGGSGDDIAEGITVDNRGAAYVTGSTTSTDFPMVAPIQGVYAGDSGAFYLHGDAFITKLNPSGTALIYSTYLGGSGDDGANDIDIDSTGAVYVTGVTTSTDFPLSNPIQPGIGFGGDENAFVTKITPAGSALTYSTYLGGILYDAGFSIAVDNTGAAHIAGETTSTDFPLQSPIQAVRAGVVNPLDYFVTTINPAGTALLYSTYLGGSGNENLPAIAVDSSGALYLTGYSDSTDFPLAAPLQGFNAGSIDITLTKIDPAGTTLLYSTYLGGSANDFSSAIAVDSTGAAYIAGQTRSADFPLVNPIKAALIGYNEAFIANLNAAGSAIIFSTYLGGNDMENASDIAVDSSGAVYTGGWTMSTDFPLTQPLQVLMYGPDAFITKISPGTPPVLSLAITPDIFFVPQGTTLAYTAAVTNTTAAKKCFQYWENITLQNGSTYPATGELFGPISLCLDAGATQSVPLTKGVPLSAPMALYALNAFVGAYGTPGHHVTVNESHFTFNVTASGPAPLKTETSWRLLEKGFK